jgi:hypothetical protein
MFDCKAYTTKTLFHLREYMLDHNYCFNDILYIPGKSIEMLCWVQAKAIITQNMRIA